MHKIISQHAEVSLKLKNGEQLECTVYASALRDLPSCPVVQVTPGGGEEWEILFEDSTSIRPHSIPDEAWVGLIRAGMVPGQDPKMAETLETCLKALAELEVAKEKYRKKVDPLTKIVRVGDREDYDEWREIPGFRQVGFPV